MTRWEYHCLHLPREGASTTEHLVEHMNDRGKDGWEVIEIESDAWGRMVWLKRPIEEREGR